MDDINSRMTVPHEEGEIPGYHEMIRPAESSVLWARDSMGRRHRHGSRTWVRFVCNNPGCPGEGIVEVGSLGTLFPPERPKDS